MISFFPIYTSRYHSNPIMTRYHPCHPPFTTLSGDPQRLAGPIVLDSSSTHGVHITASPHIHSPRLGITHIKRVHRRESARTAKRVSQPSKPDSNENPPVNLGSRSASFPTYSCLGVSAMVDDLGGCFCIVVCGSWLR